MHNNKIILQVPKVHLFIKFSELRKHFPIETNKLVEFPYQVAYLIISLIIPILCCITPNLTQSINQI